MDEFLALPQPVFRRPKRNPGHWLISALFLVFGFLMLWHAGSSDTPASKDRAILLGGIFALTGVLWLVAAFAWSRHVLGRARREYVRNLQNRYESLHCHDGRSLQTDADGFTVACRCERSRHAWADVLSFDENRLVIGLRTRDRYHVIAKSGFASPGEITEFRACVLDRLEQKRPFNSRAVDISYRPGDLRSAVVLDLVRGGGWRLLVTNIGRSFLFLLLWLFVLRFRGKFEALLWSLLWVSVFIGLAVAVTLAVAWVTLRRITFALEPCRAHFSEEGVHVQRHDSLSCVPWDNYVRYLENNRVYLLYVGPRAHDLIPKHVFGNLGHEAFHRLLTSKVDGFQSHRARDAQGLGRAART